MKNDASLCLGAQGRCSTLAREESVLMAALPEQFARAPCS